MKRFLPLLFFALSLPMAAQTTFDEMEFEEDETEVSYKVSGKNYITVRSKRGEGGVNKIPQADALVTAKSEIKEIVLVYTETQESDFDKREDANRERWENLLLTYPQLFQSGTIYKNICQCKIGGDEEAFKKTQGFYIYVTGDLPKVEEVVAVTTPPTPPAKTEKASEKKAEPTPVTTKTEKIPEKEVVVKTPEPSVVTKHEEKKETVTSVPPAKEEEEPAEEPIVKKETPVKKTVTSMKPRKAKDPKACRPACYGYGDDDLNTFFKDNMPLTKKEKKKAKNWIANVRLQLNVDGSVKKAFVTGADTDFNKRVESTLKVMNNWNAAIKNGTTVKSEVRFNLKFDKTTKAMRPADFVMNPRPTPKCKCASDSEMFDD